MKRERVEVLRLTQGRSPQGERGLKLREANEGILKETSLPARGAWVETACASACRRGFPGRSPQGERGLKRCR